MKRVCGFAESHIIMHYYAASHRVAWSVGLSVTLSVCHTSESWKKRLKRSSCHLHSGLGWAQWTTYYMTSTGQHGKGQFWVGNRQTIVKYRDTLQSSVQTRLNRLIWHFGCGLEWAKDARVQSYSPGGANCFHGRTCCHHLSINTEPSIYGGNAPYVKLLWPHVIFGHAHLDSGTDSQAFRAEYCTVGIPHNTAI